MWGNLAAELGTASNQASPLPREVQTIPQASLQHSIGSSNIVKGDAITSGWYSPSALMKTLHYGWFVFEESFGEFTVTAYLCDGELHTLARREFEERVVRASQMWEEVKTKPVQAASVAEVVRTGARSYLERFMREYHMPPTAAMWRRVIRGESDTRGETIAAEFRCIECGRRWQAHLIAASKVQQAVQCGEARCSKLL